MDVPKEKTDSGVLELFTLLGRHSSGKNRALTDDRLSYEGIRKFKNKILGLCRRSVTLTLTELSDALTEMGMPEEESRVLSKKLYDSQGKLKYDAFNVEQTRSRFMQFHQVRQRDGQEAVRIVKRKESVRYWDGC